MKRLVIRSKPLRKFTYIVYLLLPLSMLFANYSFADSEPTAEETLDYILLREFPHYKYSDLASKIFPNGSGQGRIVIEGKLAPTENIYKISRSILSKAMDTVLMSDYEKSLVVTYLRNNDKYDLRAINYFELKAAKGSNINFYLEAFYSERINGFEFRLLKFEGDVNGFSRSKLPMNSIVYEEDSYNSLISRISAAKEKIKNALDFEIRRLLEFVSNRNLSVFVTTWARLSPGRGLTPINQMETVHRAYLNFGTVEERRNIDTFTQRFMGQVNVKEIPGDAYTNYNFWPTIRGSFNKKIADSVPVQKFIAECKHYANAPQCYVIIVHPLRFNKSPEINLEYSDKLAKTFEPDEFILGKLYFMEDKGKPLLYREFNSHYRVHVMEK